MANAGTAEDRWASERGMLTLMAVALAGPVIWAIRFTIVYVMAGSACTGWGLAAMALISAAAVLLTLGATWVAWGIWQEVGSGATSAGGVVGRTRFIAMSAVLLGLSFAFLTVVESIPLFFIEPCRT
jgi:hypothetical protein